MADWKKRRFEQTISPLHMRPDEHQQVGGTHYQQMAIEPFEYAYRNNLDFFQGTLVKYVSRWRAKGGLQDLKKAKHTLNEYIRLIKSDPKKEKLDKSSKQLTKPTNMYFPDCSIHISICQKLTECLPSTYVAKNKLDTYQSDIIAHVTYWKAVRDLQRLYDAREVLEIYIKLNE